MLGVIGGIVLLGIILLLIWKLVTTIHDRKEYAKFENERKNTKFDSVSKKKKAFSIDFILKAFPQSEISFTKYLIQLNQDL